ncbi:MAG: MTAP family purine nucleoside phosphorylase, partial [Chloroflexota bacterium]
MKHAIIAGTGIYDIPTVELKEKIVETRYGDALVLMGQGEHDDLIFLPRHGVSHDQPPHKINYRANIKALADLGVKRVIANYAVGGIAPHIEPLSLTTLADILDFTHGRPFTFFDGAPDQVKHVEMSHPYCPIMSQKIIKLAPSHGLKIHKNATYVATNGPRFETPA